MSWLLFMDESGHDHRNTPFEVRGGIALHSGKLWSFVQSIQNLELKVFGTELSKFHKELKGSKLLDKDRFKWASQDAIMDDDARRKFCLRFFNKGLRKDKPVREEFTAYGQASLEMVREIFLLLRDHNAVLFASMIPRGVKKLDTYEADEFLRKDHVFLFERFYYFLEGKQKHGLLVMDEIEKNEDHCFVRKLEQYFKRTQTGRYRASWIVPTPFFVSSFMTYAVQVADICIYCINWGFRLQSMGSNTETRQEIADEFGPWLNKLQFMGSGYRDGNEFKTSGIVFVPDPYTAR